MIKVDLSGASAFFTAAGPDYALASLAHRTLLEGSGLGADFTGWVSLPRKIRETELERICAAADKIRAARSSCCVPFPPRAIPGSFSSATA